LVDENGALSPSVTVDGVGVTGTLAEDNQDKGTAGTGDVADGNARTVEPSRAELEEGPLGNSLVDMKRPMRCCPFGGSAQNGLSSAARFWGGFLPGSLLAGMVDGQCKTQRGTPTGERSAWHE
jgi:hypothetical protein